MNKFIDIFANSALASLKNTVASANAAMQSFSLNDIGKAMDEAKERFAAEFNRFKNSLYSFTDKHTVEVKFDKATQKINYSITQNIFNVSVNSIDGTVNQNASFTLPEDVDATEMHQTYDSENKVMVFRFGKKKN